MKRGLTSFVLCLAIWSGAGAQNDSLLKLWYNHPAKQWVEALPIGNGRLGAMIYGDPCKETVQLNEITVWGGQPNRNDNPDARETLPEVRRLIFEGKYKEAQDLVNRKFISKISQGMPYQTVGNLRLIFPGHEHYTTRYIVDGVQYESQAFASFPDQVMIVRITSDKPGSINFSASMDRPAAVKISTRGDNTLIMSGVTGDCDSVKGKVQFQAQVEILADGGAVHATDTALAVANANGAIIPISVPMQVPGLKHISRTR
jgi:alpha-L-fucosidase 2